MYKRTDIFFIVQDVSEDYSNFIPLFLLHGTVCDTEFSALAFCPLFYFYLVLYCSLGFVFGLIDVIPPTYPLCVWCPLLYIYRYNMSAYFNLTLSTAEAFLIADIVQRYKIWQQCCTLTEYLIRIYGNDERVVIPSAICSHGLSNLSNTVVYLKVINTKLPLSAKVSLRFKLYYIIYLTDSRVPLNSHMT